MVEGEIFEGLNLIEYLEVSCVFSRTRSLLAMLLALKVVHPKRVFLQESRLEQLV